MEAKKLVTDFANLDLDEKRIVNLIKNFKEVIDLGIGLELEKKRFPERQPEYDNAILTNYMASVNMFETLRGCQNRMEPGELCDNITNVFTKYLEYVKKVSALPP